MALDVLKRYYSQLGLGLCLAISGVWGFLANQAHAQITPDTTLPQGERSLVDLGSGEVNGKIVDLIKGGAIRDINLFHSFLEFNVGDGQSVYFANPAGIQNILSRVTGGNPSNILGTLGVNGGANLFLINPKGIFFGDKAKLDVSGSFVGTTADGIGFGNRGVFSASNPEPPSPLLTVNPNVFFFNQIPGKITSQAKLEKLAVDNLLLLGGDIEVSKKENSKVDSKISTNQGGNILLAGLGAPGEVELTTDGNKLGLDFPDGVKKGNVVIKNSAIETSVAKDSDVDGGDIRIIADSLKVENSEKEKDRGIFTKAENNGRKSGDIIITADESLLVRSTSTKRGDNGIFTMTNKKGGEGGKITIDTGSLTVETARKEQGIFTTTKRNGQKGGDIIITADDSISIIASSGNNQHGIFTFTDKKGGPGGSIEITTASLMIESEKPTPGISAITDGDGDSGSIAIDVTGDVLLKKQGTIQTEQGNSKTKGSVGNISLKVNGNVTLADNSRIKSENSGKGTGGKVTILAGGAVEIKYGSTIENTTKKDAEGNNNGVFIEADSLLLDARKDPSNPESERGFVQITAKTNSKAGGDGGSIDIRVGSLTMIGTDSDKKSGSDGITANTKGDGNAGNITIIVEGDFIMTDRAQIEAQSQKGATGNGGEITIEAGSLFLSKRSIISSETRSNSKGNPGNISITAKDKIELNYSDIQTLVLAGAGNPETAQNTPGGVGNITITARSLSLKDGGKLEASTRGKLPGGKITVNATDFVEISGKNRSRIVTETRAGAEGKGGRIDITTPSLRLSDRVFLDAKSESDFDGGEIKINADDVQLTDGAEIIATSKTSEGGDITIDVDTLTVNNSKISASTETGTAGNVEVNAKDSVWLTGNLPDKSKSPAGIFAQATEGGTARNVTIETDDLTVENGARIAVSAVPLDQDGFPDTDVDESDLGVAGKLEIKAESLTLDKSQLVAATGQKTDNKEAATIDIDVSGLTTLDNNSLILADATGDNVKGGNITIDGGLLILFPSDGETGNDIFANAEEGQGGEISITLQGLFANFRLQDGPTRFNDISAINLKGNSSLDGLLQINAAVNPTQDPEILPTAIVDPSALIVANCPRSGKVAVDELGEFIVTGRGGLPPSPLDPITQRSVLADWVTLDTEEETIEEAKSTPTPDVSYLPMRGKRRAANTPTPARRKKIVEAQGWTVGEDGTIILTAEPNTGTPKSNWYNPRSCGSKG